MEHAAMKQMLLCARYELVLAVRSRWLQAFGVVFALLVLLVAGSGYILSGGYGLQDFSRTAESLVQLVVLLVPLTALTFGGLSLIPDPGAAELLYAQPVSRGRILIGRFLGLLLALSAAQAIGFGAAGVVLAHETGTIGAGAFLVIVALSFVLGAVFLSVAALLAQTRTGGRGAVLAAALAVWFVAVILYDLAALGAASVLHSGAASRLLMTAALVNPVDSARTAALMAIEGTTAFGAASLALLRFTGGEASTYALSVSSMLVWACVPLLLAVRRLHRADL